MIVLWTQVFVTPTNIIILCIKYLHNKSAFINIVWQRKSVILLSFIVKKGNIL